MGDVSQILGRLENEKQGDRPKRDDGRPQLEWKDVLKQDVQVGERGTIVRTARKGATYSLGFVNEMGRPSGVFGSASALKDARADVLAAVNAAFDKVEAEEAAHQARRGEKKPNAGNGPVEVRHTGKTERERQKKLGKLKA